MLELRLCLILNMKMYKILFYGDMGENVTLPTHNANGILGFILIYAQMSTIQTQKTFLRSTFWRKWNILKIQSSH